MFTRTIWSSGVKLAAPAAVTAGIMPAPRSTCLRKFGLIDVTLGDTVRVNLVHVPGPGSSGGTCTVQASIVQPPAGLCFDCLPTTLAGPSTVTLSPNQKRWLGGTGVSTATESPSRFTTSKPKDLAARS